MTAPIFVFDAYGTLFDVAAAARRLADAAPDTPFALRWVEVAENWRQKQLSYSWLRQITGHYVDFWQITQESLDWALEATDLADPELRVRLLELYEQLDAYPEVHDVLRRLKEAGATTAILSNGSHGMLSTAVTSAGIGDLLDDVLSVETIGVFKPDPRVYAIVDHRFGTSPRAVRFVSSNGWDVAGAALHGFRTVWVNRRSEPVERLPARPELVAPDLSDLPHLLEVR